KMIRNHNFRVLLTLGLTLSPSRNAIRSRDLKFRIQVQGKDHLRAMESLKAQHGSAPKRIQQLGRGTMKSAIFCAIAIVFLSACSKDSKPKEDKPKEGFSLFSKTQPTFTVTDEMGLPLVAEVLVGDKLNDPPNNMVYTDPSGVAPIPDSWTD